MNYILGGKYLILNPLGEGSSSKVMLAVDLNTKDKVAIKIVKNAAGRDISYFNNEV